MPEMMMASNDNFDPEKEKNTHEAIETAGAAAGAGAGCLFMALMPWSLLAVIMFIVFIVWMFWSHYQG